jgi:S1-C subfamily serine protease
MKGVIAALAISAAVIMAVDLRSPYSKAVINTVWIEAGDGTGTGVFVDDYLILTAAHVVEGKADIVAHSPILDGGSVVSSPDRYENGRLCQIIAIDMPKDLALLRVKRRGIPVKVAAGEPSPGDPLFSIGCGDGTALFGFSTGHVRQVYDAGFPRVCGDYQARSIDMSCPVNFGDSGGPVIANGELVGIITGMDAMKNQTYLAVTAGEIREFLARVK